MPSEFDLIRRYFVRPTPGTLLGPGDDCALLAPTQSAELAVTSDMLVSGVHFLADTDPGDLGWKALAVNLSDLAAMGARPRWAVLALSLPDADEDWLRAFSVGLFACADAFTVDIVGGDTTRGPRNICITALGEVPPYLALRRSGASVGDDIWISGPPGLAALGLAQLQGRLNLPGEYQAMCTTALQRPQPRVALGLALRGIASAAIDVSDGLLADLAHVLTASSTAAVIDAAALPNLPVEPTVALTAQLSGGDDYELLFTAPVERREAVTKLAADLGLSPIRLGRIIDSVAGEVQVLGRDGQALKIAHRGFDHFQ